MGNVKIFRSTDYGAVQLDGTIGRMITLLDSLLVNGYGDLSVTSLTHSGGVVTCETASPHGLLDFSRQTIAGVANDTAYNGEHIITVTGPSTFTYQKAGITISPATGTITTKSASAGWTKPYSGTNLAAYRTGGGNQRYLRVDDTTTITTRVNGYETMTGISTGNNPFPSAAQFSGGLYFQKSSVATAAVYRPWIMIADDRQFFLHVDWNSGGTFGDSPIHHFGDFVSYKSGDVYNTHIRCNISGAVAGFRFLYVSATVQATDTGHYICRSYSQVGTSMPGSTIADYSKGNAQAVLGAATGLPYPHPVDGGIWMSPVYVCETAVVAASSVVRGYVNGLFGPLHNLPLAHMDTFTGTGSMAGRTFMALRGQLNGMCLIEIPLTWTW